jgi:hypothetical protein
MAKGAPELHPAIKQRLGYALDRPDAEVMADWKHRSTQVCKPCWELKYCPYGPFVEQAPLLPSLREDAVEHSQRLAGMLESNTIGDVQDLTDERREYLEGLVELHEIEPIAFAFHVAQDFYREKQIAESHASGGTIEDVFRPPDGPIEVYRVPSPLDLTEPDGKEEVPEFEITEELQAAIDERLASIRNALETGKEDSRRALDPARRESFQRSVSSFNPEDYPLDIPEEISRMECNIFGHICPVVFVGESITETSEIRRSGRYISFKTKIRVVRRDNYTCQSCGKHLRDDEVEFDHVIPVARGGSSEEHNLRLTCFDCNRSKSDNPEI